MCHVTKMKALAFLMLVVVACGGSPQLGTIEGEASCGDCRVQLVEVARLTSPDGGGQPDFPVTLFHHRAGYYLFGPTLVRGAIAVFDRTGSLQQVVGREGSGPGEMKEVMSVGKWRGD